MNTYNGLTLEGKKSMSKASEKNTNMFYQSPQVKTPIISIPANLSEMVLKPTYVNAIKTKGGEAFVLIKNRRS